MTHTDILNRLKQKAYKPVYILMGDESYFIDLISNEISENVLTEDEKSFNQTILYGKDTDVNTIITTCRRYPMMAERQVVIVKEAQNIRNLESDLLPYFKQVMPSTLLVICYKYGQLDGRKALLKEAKKVGEVFHSKKIYDNQLPAWIINHVKSQGYTIDMKSAHLLAEFVGSDLSRLVNEIDKLMIVLKDGQTIRAEDIEKNIGISKDFNVFELQKSIGQKDVLKANRIVNYFASNPSKNAIPATISLLYSYFNKILKLHFASDKSDMALSKTLGVHHFFVKEYKAAARNYPIKKCVEIVATLREYDMKSKGVGSVSATEGDLQRELIYKILH